MHSGGFLEAKSLGRLDSPLMWLNSTLYLERVDIKVATLLLVENSPLRILFHAWTHGRLSVSSWIRWRDSLRYGPLWSIDAAILRASIYMVAT